MSRIANVLESFRAHPVSLEEFDRHGELRARLDGAQFIRCVQACRPALAEWRKAGEDSLALVFRPEETIEFLVTAFAAFAEGLVIVPVYPNWSGETQKQYLDAYRLRAFAFGEGYRSRVESWKTGGDYRALHVDLQALLADLPGEGFPGDGDRTSSGNSPLLLDIPPDRSCAWIFTSGTSGKVANLTDITFGNVEAAVDSIQKVDFLGPDMVVHNPLSVSHVFAFVAVLAFMTLRPKRVLFSDVQYLARLPESRTGKIDGMILVPIVIHRLRSGFYERLAKPIDRKTAPPELRRIARLPLCLRRLLKRIVLRAEESVMEVEATGSSGPAGWLARALTRRLFGRMLASRLGSPRFVVVGGARPEKRAMAFVEAMGVRCLQGWGMTETTGPLAVCAIGDRYRGAFGTCGKLFDRTRGRIEGGELVVEGAQVARGYRSTDGTVVPFCGVKRTGDQAEFDSEGRLRILGKASERITTANGINYSPVVLEEAIHALDLDRENLLEQVVVLGEGQASLGGIFFLRERPPDPGGARRYVESLVRAFNESRSVDERIGAWEVHPDPLRESGFLGPTGKLRRRQVEEAYLSLFRADGEARD